MSEGPVKRRWFQFRLRTIFICVTLVALVLGWVMRGVHEARKDAFWAELKIRDQFSEDTTIDFTNVPLDEAADYIKDLHGIETALDTAAFEKAGLAYQRLQLTQQHTGALSKALRDTLGPYRLSFMIKNGACLYDG